MDLTLLSINNINTLRKSLSEMINSNYGINVKPTDVEITSVTENIAKPNAMELFGTTSSVPTTIYFGTIYAIGTINKTEGTMVSFSIYNGQTPILNWSGYSLHPGAESELPMEWKNIMFTGVEYNSIHGYNGIKTPNTAVAGVTTYRAIFDYGKIYYNTADKVASKDGYYTRCFKVKQDVGSRIDTTKNYPLTSDSFSSLMDTGQFEEVYRQGINPSTQNQTSLDIMFTGIKINIT